jgi:heme/copper-type cytochrome/quinol oxidase subunit 2
VPPRQRSRSLLAASLALLLVTIVAAVAAVVQNPHEFSVSARRYAFSVQGTTVPEIRVQQDDLVQIMFSAEDIPHSFTIDDDHYRISRRAEPGKPVKFDFRADKVGSFPITCALTIDPRCRELQARLVVEPRK